jgi:Transcriptional regulatory protein, C terminal
MGVNSAFKGYFNNRWMVGSGIAVLALATFFLASSFTKRSDSELRAKQANLMVRQLGHRLLLQAGDSTSRVLPVAEMKEGTFLLTFENEFVFNHDSLMMLAQDLFPKTQFPSGYTVTVHECMKADIVYGFQINNTSADILACQGRSQPTGCYTIEISFPDFYEATFNYSFINLAYSGILVLLGVALLIGRFGKNTVTVPVQTQDHSIIKEFAPELNALGKFLFDVKGQRLLLGSEEISLTDKECKVLDLLNKNFGELIPRETLMQKIWINEGVITGRSLDMFVSKLRKKLSGDPELRITNVHGKGYKLEIPEV